MGLLSHSRCVATLAALAAVDGASAEGFWSQFSDPDDGMFDASRIGIMADAGERGSISVFVGATYLREEVDLVGSVAFETPGGPEGDTTEVSFVINQRNKDRWNYLVGFNWDLSKRWSINGEGGFGGSRDNFIGGVTYRY